MKSRLHDWAKMPEEERREVGRRMIARRWELKRAREKLPPPPKPLHVPTLEQPVLFVPFSEHTVATCPCVRCLMRRGVV